LGLHTFGEAPSPEHRISTVMQQLGEPFYRLLGTEPGEFFATDNNALQASPPYRLLWDRLRTGVASKVGERAELTAMLERADALDRHLAQTGEVEALLAGLSGALIAPGHGGDPIRNPDVPSGRNIYPFEPDKIPSRAAYEAGGTALQQLIDAYRADHGGEAPQKLAFSLWGSETMRHLGIQESQILHALGLSPVWNEGGRVTRLDIIPHEQLGRPRIDAVVQVTSVYRDQFDGFMRMLAEAIERLAALDEPDSAIARNTSGLAKKLSAQGQSPERSRKLASLRIFSNEAGDYGTDLPGTVLKSTSWNSDTRLAEAYLDRMQYAYGSKEWGTRIDGPNLFAEQLRGVQAAALSRSSKLQGILSTDHPFEYLGGLSLAIRHLDGKSPALYISDFREQASRVTSVARFLSDEMRSRTLNPHWIGGMQKEGYAGTLEILNAVNNLFGWQVTDPSTVRADQWQSVHETFIRDKHQLGLAAWFTQNNPTAEGQIIERMIEAVRKGYWNASGQTRRELVERWQELTAAVNAHMGEPVTRAFIAEISKGFDLPKATLSEAPAQTVAAPLPETIAAPAQSAGEQVRGVVMKPIDAPDAGGRLNWLPWIGLGLLLACFLAGAVAQFRSSIRLNMERPIA
jgi:cobaltochelatase CobN